MITLNVGDDVSWLLSNGYPEWGTVLAIDTGILLVRTSTGTTQTLRSNEKGLKVMMSAAHKQ